MSDLIGLCGAKGSGKDTVAAILARHGYQRLAFADALKDEVADLLSRRDGLIRQRGGVVWKVTGRAEPPSGIAGHITEEVDLIEADDEIWNGGTMQQLEMRVSMALLRTPVALGCLTR